jgi:hypothetical protein
VNLSWMKMEDGDRIKVMASVDDSSASSLAIYLAV